MTGSAEGPKERRRLAAELRALRAQAGLSGRELASGIDRVSQSKVSRIEAGTAMPTLAQIERWAELTGATPEKTRNLLMLAERAFNEIHAWGTLLKDRPHQQDEIGKREGGARMVRTFEPLIVPGLLQTAEYARQVFDLSPLATVREGVPAAVSARMDRQLALYDPGQRFEFLITEASLRWCPGQEGRGLLPAQLDRVHSLSTLRNVSIGVIRDGAPALTYAAHGFVIYEGRDADDVCVGVEAVHAGMALHDPDVIEMYERTWTALKRTALFGDEARQIVIEHLSAFRVPAE